MNGDPQNANNEVGALKEQIAELNAAVSGLKDTVRAKDIVLADWEAQFEAQCSFHDPVSDNSVSDDNEESENGCRGTRNRSFSPTDRDAGAQAPLGSPK